MSDDGLPEVRGGPGTEPGLGGQVEVLLNGMEPALGGDKTQRDRIRELMRDEEIFGDIVAFRQKHQEAVNWLRGNDRAKDLLRGAMVSEGDIGLRVLATRLIGVVGYRDVSLIKELSRLTEVRGQVWVWSGEDRDLAGEAAGALRVILDREFWDETFEEFRSTISREASSDEARDEAVDRIFKRIRLFGYRQVDGSVYTRMVGQTMPMILDKSNSLTDSNRKSLLTALMLAADMERMTDLRDSLVAAESALGMAGVALWTGARKVLDV